MYNLGKKPTKPQQSYLDSFKNSLFNLSYRFFKPSKQLPLTTTTTTQSTPTIQRYLSGHPAPTTQSIHHHLSHTLWFTYSSGQTLLTTHTTDAGWGCMARVGQMCLAQLLKTHNLRHFKTHASELELCKSLIHLFEDNNKYSPYSLEKILNCRTARMENVKQGRWMKVGQIVGILEELQNQGVVKGYEELKVVAGNMVVVYQQVVRAMGYKLCRHGYVKCRECGNAPQKFNSVALIISCGLGEDRRVVKQLMKIKQFIGMLGGIPGKAHYFLGFQHPHELNLIYLDPHYVHKSTSAGQPNTTSHFCTDYLTVNISKIDMSVGFCFYFGSPEDLVGFQEAIEGIMREFRESFPFGVEVREEKGKGGWVRDLDVEEMEKGKEKSESSWMVLEEEQGNGGGRLWQTRFDLSNQESYH